MRAFVFFSLLFGHGVSLHADNSTITSLYKGAAKYCGSIKLEDLNVFGQFCRADDMGRFKKIAFAVLAYRIFEEAAIPEIHQNQLIKNNCLQDQIDSYTNPVKHPKAPERFEAFRLSVAATWIGIRKADLIIQQCQKIDTMIASSLTPEQKTRPLGYRLPSLITESFPPRTIEICTNEEKKKSLKNMRELSLYALPGVSAPEFFDVMNDYRDILINKKTGKPVTDQEIENEDLNDLSFLTLTHIENPDLKDPGLRRRTLEFDQEIHSLFQGIKSQRAEMNRRIKEAPQFPTGIDQDLRDDMYLDGTMLRTLQNRRLLPEDFSTLNEAKTSGKKLNNAAACLMTRYEPSVKGDWVNFFATATGVGMAQKAKKVSGGALSSLRAGFQRGLLATMPLQLSQLAQTMYKKCQPSYKAQETKASQMQIYTYSALHLPKEIPLSKAKIDLDPEETPSCTEAHEKNLILRKSTDCGQALMVQMATMLGLSKVPLAPMVGVTSGLNWKE